MFNKFLFLALFIALSLESQTQISEPVLSPSTNISSVQTSDCGSVEVTFRDLRYNADTIIFDIYYRSLSYPDGPCPYFQFFDQDIFIFANPMAFDNPSINCREAFIFDFPTPGTNQFFCPSTSTFYENTDIVLAVNGPFALSKQFSPKIDSVAKKLWTIEIIGYNGLFDPNMRIPYYPDMPNLAFNPNFFTWSEDNDDSHESLANIPDPSILIDSNNLSCVEIISPVDSAGGITSNTQFLWHSVDHADEYALIFLDEEKEDIIHIDYVTDTFYQYENFPASYGIELNWRVIALNDSLGWNGCDETYQLNTLPCDTCQTNCPIDNPADAPIIDVRIDSTSMYIENGIMYLPLLMKVDDASTLESISLSSFLSSFLYDSSEMHFLQFVNDSLYQSINQFGSIPLENIYLNVASPRVENIRMTEVSGPTLQKDVWKTIGTFEFIIKKPWLSEICPVFIWNQLCEPFNLLPGYQPFINNNTFDVKLSQINFVDTNIGQFYSPRNCVNDFDSFQGIVLMEHTSLKSEYWILDSFALNNNLQNLINIQSNISGNLDFELKQLGNYIELIYTRELFLEEIVEITFLNPVLNPNLLDPFKTKWRLKSTHSTPSNAYFVKQSKYDLLDTNILKQDVELITKDLNNDGLLDHWVVGRPDSSSPKILHSIINIGEDYIIGSSTPLPLNESKIFALKDINKDGFIDIALTSKNPDFICLGLNNGNGDIPIFNKIFTPNLNDASLSDINGDSKVDLVVLQSIDNQPFQTQIKIFDYSDQFFNQLIYENELNLSVRFVHDMDLDSDGKIDILICGETSAGEFSNIIFRNIDGTNFETLPLTLDNNFCIAKVLDINNDGFDDFINDNGTFAYLGDGSGMYPSTALIDLESDHINSIFADFNGDGHTDIVSHISGENAHWKRTLIDTSIAPQTFDGFFSLPTAQKMQVQDFNSDGKMDFTFIDDKSNLVFAKNVDCTVICQNDLALGFGSLQDAVYCAQAGDTIIFDECISNDTLELTDGVFIRKDSLTILGPSDRDLVIKKKTNPFSIFAVFINSRVRIENLTLLDPTFNSSILKISDNSTVTLCNNRYFIRQYASNTFFESFYGKGINFEGYNTIKYYNPN